MPTISIRAHGVSASRNQQLVNPETGEIVRLTSFQQPERTATKGWTSNVARRNEQRLQQVDFEAVDGVPAFVTLTMTIGFSNFRPLAIPICICLCGLTMTGTHWSSTVLFGRGSTC